MVFTFNPRRGKSITIESEDGISVSGASGRGRAMAGLMMDLALKAHASVVVFAKETDFYEYMAKTPVDFIDTFTSKRLFEELKYPWVGKLTLNARNTLKKVMEEAGQGRDLVYLKGRAAGTMPYLMPPGLGHSFYQIKDAGAKKDRVLCEAVFSALLEDACTERMREVVFFYDAPYKPATEAAISAIRKADKEGVALIGMYPKDSRGYKAGNIVTGADVRGLYIIRNGKKERVGNEYD